MLVAQEFKPDYIVCGNNDVLFSPGWWQGLCRALAAGYAMAGPVSNAPGVTAPNGLQHVRRYFPDYPLSDDPVSIGDTAQRLRASYMGKVVPSPVNGFFMMAESRTWLEHGYSRGMPFPPTIEELPSGKPNPTPTMTGQEEWIQNRWGKKGLKSCVVPASFIFHYRSVARGAEYAVGDCVRMAGRTAR
jgi:hypothetical protein